MFAPRRLTRVPRPRKQGVFFEVRTPMAKLVYSFGDGAAEGDPKRRDLLGGKGAGLDDIS